MLDRTSSILAWLLCSHETFIDFLRSPVIAASSEILYSDKISAITKDEETPKLVAETAHVYTFRLFPSFSG